MNKAKEYLNQIRDLDAAIKRRQKEVEELRETAMSASAKLDANRIRTDSPDPDPLAAKIAKWVDIEHELDDMIDELIELKHTVIGQIQKIGNSKYCEILWMRYVDMETFDQIAESTGYSVRHVLRLHGEALQRFNKIFYVQERK